MPIVADVAAGPVFLFAGLIAGLAALLPIVLVEAVVLRLLNWGSFRRSLRDSLVVNVVTTIVGIVIGILFFPWYNTPPIVFGVLAWVYSIVVEALLLGLLEHNDARRTWTASALMNTVSSVLLGAFAYLASAT